MARSFTLAQLRTKVRERADMVHSTFVTDSELNGYISASYAELYDILVKSGMAFFEKTQTITTNGSATYALPADYYGSLGVDYKHGDEWLEVPMFQFSDRNNFPSSAPWALGWRVVGTNVEFAPAPPSGQEYRHIYIPSPADLSNDTDTVDGVSGWEEYIVVDAAIKCLQKEESAVGHLVGDRNRLMERIEAAAQNRLFGQPLKVRDTMGGEPAPVWDSFRWRRG